MSNVTPVYRSFRRAYGGDPDSSVLRDLHKRLMRTEIDLSNAEAAIVEILARLERFHLHADPEDWEGPPNLSPK